MTQWIFTDLIFSLTEIARIARELTCTPKKKPDPLDADEFQSTAAAPSSPSTASSVSKRNLNTTTTPSSSVSKQSSTRPISPASPSAASSVSKRNPKTSSSTASPTPLQCASSVKSGSSPASATDPASRDPMTGIGSSLTNDSRAGGSSTNDFVVMDDRLLTDSEEAKPTFSMMEFAMKYFRQVK